MLIKEGRRIYSFYTVPTVYAVQLQNEMRKRKRDIISLRSSLMGYLVLEENDITKL